mmetsp:Transcript_15029/g.27316  ORF Transcript_15029/g.27316 Transcript_15029/m.27316 type:complete len:139 (-) Transcript_15029:488-904(-)
MKQDWNLGDSPDLTREKIALKITQLYVNIRDDGTWKQELAQTDQIIAIATQVAEMKRELASTSIALATATSAGNTNDSTSGVASGKQPYTVKPFCLEFKGESIVVGGTTYYWCTCDHWSNMAKYNGMYCMHCTADHAA